MSFGSDSGQDRGDRGAVGLLWMLAGLGAIPVIHALAQGEIWGFWPTLGALIVGFSMFGLWRSAVERRCGPRARKD